MSCLKQGCLLSTVFLVLLLLGAAVAGLLAFVQVKSENVERTVIEHERIAATPGEGSGRVILELGQAEVDIKPAGEGEPFRVRATFDTNSYDLIEQFDPDTGEGWTWRIVFRQTRAALLTPFALALGGNRPRLRIHLPASSPFTLVADLSEGGYELELGGLSLTAMEIAFARGELELDFDKPLRVPMETLVLRCEMGSFDISRVGNASPRRLEAIFGMGEADLDLRGVWSRDAQIEFSCDMGEGELRLPRDVFVAGLDGWSGARPGAGLDAPTLTISATSSMGELKIED